MTLNFFFPIINILLEKKHLVNIFKHNLIQQFSVHVPTRYILKTLCASSKLFTTTPKSNDILHYIELTMLIFFKNSRNCKNIFNLFKIFF